MSDAFQITDADYENNEIAAPDSPKGRYVKAVHDLASAMAPYGSSHEDQEVAALHAALDLNNHVKRLELGSGRDTDAFHLLITMVQHDEKFGFKFDELLEQVRDCIAETNYSAPGAR